MAKHQILTEKGIQAALKGLKKGQRLEIMDKTLPGFGIRNWTYFLAANFTRGGDTTRRALGKVGDLSLEEARLKAQRWKSAIRAGKDPAIEEERQRQSEARQRRVTLAAVAEAFIEEKLPGERKGEEVARDIRRDLLPKLGKRPINEIMRIDIRELIKDKKKTAPAQARNLLGYTKRLFSWAVDQDCYGIQASPCSDIKAKEIIGTRSPASRILSDDEIFALWRAASRHQPYPYRQIYQLLLLNGLRLNEVADASDPEFKPVEKRDWTIPKTRMKGRNETVRDHLVPLTSASLEILGTLPTHGKGPYLFSCNFGASPVWVNSKIKKQIDAAMLLTLKALARKRGQDPDGVELPHWTNHDIRRTVRTNLSTLRDKRGHKIPDEVKEAVIAHAKPGIKGVYDKYDFADEKFEALELWAERLTEIIARGSDQQRRNILPFKVASNG